MNENEVVGFLKEAFGLSDPGDTFEHSERVSAGLGTHLVKRDHGDQSGVSDISISTPPDVAARKLLKLRAPDGEKIRILIRAGFPEEVVQQIMERVQSLDMQKEPSRGF